MPITTLALLRIQKPSTAARVDSLSDSVIVHMDQAFSSEPEALSAALAEQLGDAALGHEDPRGVLFIPSVAAPKAQSYEAVIAEVGEGGQWGPAPAVLLSSSVQESGFADLLGGMLGQLPPALMAQAQAALSGDGQALGAMTSQLQQMLGSSPALAGLAEQLSGMMGGAAKGQPGEQLDALEQMFAGFGASEASQSSLREMVLNMQEELVNDPSKLDQLTQQLFGDKKK